MNTTTQKCIHITEHTMTRILSISHVFVLCIHTHTNTYLHTSMHAILRILLHSNKNNNKYKKKSSASCVNLINKRKNIETHSSLQK